MLKISLSLLDFGLTKATQAQTLCNETIGTMGSQAINLSSDLRVQQSIGQSSIKGTFTTHTAYLSQGFLRGRITPSKEIFLPFSVVAFPNAFEDQIRFRFTSDHVEPTQERIHDSQGKKVYEQLHLPKNQEIEIQLAHLAPGIYLVELSTNNRSTQVRILKNR